MSETSCNWQATSQSCFAYGCSAEWRQLTACVQVSLETAFGPDNANTTLAAKKARCNQGAVLREPWLEGPTSAQKLNNVLKSGSRASQHTRFECSSRLRGTQRSSPVRVPEAFAAGGANLKTMPRGLQGLESRQGPGLCH